VPSLTVENYVKTIALIAARDPSGSAVSTGELAHALGVSPGTVTGMLKTLSETNLATYTPYEGARLSESGQRLAMRVIRRHRLLERFLAETLTMPWDEVHEEAEHMEHAASERLIDRIDAFLGYPAVDPHGDPIPRADGSLAETEGMPLARCQPGQRFRVVRVMDQDPAFLRYLSECGLELNAVGEVLENRPEAGALVCRLNEKSLALGVSAAGKVVVHVLARGGTAAAESSGDRKKK
jgi:DtxR family Mn-dependent transcriptional regulator